MFLPYPPFFYFICGNDGRFHYHRCRFSWDETAWTFSVVFAGCYHKFSVYFALKRMTVYKYNSTLNSCQTLRFKCQCLSSIITIWNIVLAHETNRCNFSLKFHSKQTMFYHIFSCLRRLSNLIPSETFILQYTKSRLRLDLLS